MRILVFLFAVRAAHAGFSCDAELSGPTELICLLESAPGESAASSSSFQVVGRTCSDEFSVTSALADGRMSPAIHNFAAGACQVFFANFRHNATGMSLCAQLSCGGGPAETECAAVQVPNPCGEMTSCAACTDTADCGWCAGTQTCLRSRGGGGGDWCGECPNFVGKGGCSVCPNNCGGRNGACQPDGTCTCLAGWSPASGDRSCERFDPASVAEDDGCVHLETAVYTPTFGTSQYTRQARFDLHFDPNTWVSQPAFFAVVVDEAKAPGHPPLHYRFNGQVDAKRMVYDGTSSADAAAAGWAGVAGCPGVLGAAAGKAPLLFVGNVPRREDFELWLGVAADGTVDEAALTVVVGYCAAGFTGWPCTVQVTHANPYGTGLDTGAAPPPQPLLLQDEVLVDVPWGSTVYVQFPIGHGVSDVSLTAALVEDRPSTYLRQELFRKGKLVKKGADTLETVELPLPSDDWGVEVFVDAPSGATGFATVKLTVALTVCEYLVDSDCVRVRALGGKFTWHGEDGQWLHSVHRVEWQAQVFEIDFNPEIQLHSERVVARYEAFPDPNQMHVHVNAEKTLYVVSGRKLVITNPRTGYWYLGFHATNVHQPVQVDPQVTIRGCTHCVSPAACQPNGGATVSTCTSASGCSASSQVTVQECSEWQTLPPVVPALPVDPDVGGIPDSPTTVFVSLIPGPNLQQPDDDAGSSGSLYIALVCLFASVVIVGYLTYSYKQKRKLAKQEGAAPPPADAFEMSDTDGPPAAQDSFDRQNCPAD
ncbi:hypothetical protein DIPPA_22955 [Diplonema papillatum]|nr:hypothetical protein DIPPA_22955 [Diplonema papillatum]